VTPSRVERTYNGNPLVGVRTCARHADGQLGGLGSELGVGVLRASSAICVLGFQQCKSFVEMGVMCTVRCCPLWYGDSAPGAGAAHCPMGTVPRVLVRRTASPDHAFFWRAELGSPHRRPTRCRASPAPIFCADCAGLSVGWIEHHDVTHDRCFSTLVFVYFAHRMGSV
jgi:hypothetical protein